MSNRLWSALFLHSNTRITGISKSITMFMIRTLNVMRKFLRREFITLTLRRRRSRRKHPFQSTIDKALKIYSPFSLFGLVDRHLLLFLPPIECSFCTKLHDKIQYKVIFFPSTCPVYYSYCVPLSFSIQFQIRKRAKWCKAIHNGKCEWSIQHSLSNTLSVK